MVNRKDDDDKQGWIRKKNFDIWTHFKYNASETKSEGLPLQKEKPDALSALLDS